MLRRLALLLLLLNSAASGQEWQSLFDGESLAGWIPKVRGYPPGENYADTFRIEDGAIAVTYDGYESFDERFGHLFFETPFSHYRLRLEYRFVGDQAPGGEDWAFRNSGVMFHAQAPATMPPEQDFPISLEFQFLGGRGDGKPRPTAAMCSPGTEVDVGGIQADSHCVAAEAPTVDGDGWVKVELLALGADLAVHYVNGQAVIEYTRLSIGGGVVSGHNPATKLDGELLSGGYLALQSESHPIRFRNIEILNLRGCMDEKAVNFRPYFVEPDPASCQH